MTIDSSTTPAKEPRAPRSARSAAASSAQFLKKPTVRGSFWTVLMFGSRQVIRLGGNLVLQRLLLPEIFGVMAIVNIFLQGLQLFSDIGIGPSIIQSKRGDDARYLRTAWCVQIFRGVWISIAAALLAWPVAAAKSEPAFLVYLPAAALSFVIAGFNPTTLFVLNRKLHLGKLTLLDLGSNIVGVLVMVGWAFVWPSVWALIVSRWVSASVKMAAAHWMAPKPRMGFEFEKESAIELFKFGRWLFLGTLFTFLAMRSDALIVGWYLHFAEFGIYYQALMVVSLPVQVVTMISSRVLFPIYANTARRDMNDLRAQVRRVRLGLLAATVPPLILLTLAGPEITGFLFDERYQAAGWMIQVLGVGAIFVTILVPVSSTLLAVGDSFGQMVFQIARTASIIVFVILGGWLGTRGITVFGYTYTPLTGLLTGYVVGSLAYYPILAAQVRKHNTWMPGIDFLAVTASLALLALGFWLRTQF